MIRAITLTVVALIVIGILLVLLGANQKNGLVDFLLDIARFLVGPFKDVFDLKERKAEVAVNWGLAAVIYAAVGLLIARLLARR
ncbi:MAG: hypothetical protein WKF94_15800 [Solirubrobacteraceae bacterium]